jgi:beta-galactosidase
VLINYHQEILNYYEALHSQNISCDIIGEGDDLNGYDIVIAPILYMVKGDYDKNIREYVENGGTFVTTYFSGYVDESDLVYGAYPGKLRDILGIWVEESDALPEGEENSFTIDEKEYTSKILCDIIHTEGSKVLASYNQDFYAGTPVITENDFGRGKAYYIGTSSDTDFYKTFTKKLCAEKNIKPDFAAYEGLEVTKRYGESCEFTFLLNHSDKPIAVTIEDDVTDIITNAAYTKNQRVEIKPKDVLILNRE